MQIYPVAASIIGHFQRAPRACHGSFCQLFWAGCLVCWFVFGSMAWAKEIRVLISGNHFQHLELVVRPGDTVLFINQDGHDHSIFSISEDLTFDLGVFSPGEIKALPIPKQMEGVIEVRCALSRNMRMTITVELE